VDAFEDVIELHVVYGFKHPIVIDLETVDSDWLDGRCDVVEVRLVARRDERAVRTIDGPISVRFTRAKRQGPFTKWEWANAGDCSTMRLQSPMNEHRDLAVHDIVADLARQAARRRAPICHGTKCRLNLQVDLTNKSRQQRGRRKCGDLTGSLPPNGPHRHE
jgi:hypothetical protein